MIETSYALVGAAVLWAERNDHPELGVLRTWFWALMEFALLSAGLWYWYSDVETWRIAVAAVIIMLVFTAGHSMILSPPGSKYPDKPNALEKFVIDFSDTPVVAWWANALIRYVLPLQIAGAFLGQMYLAAAGLIVVLGYWPIAYWINPYIKNSTGETTKFTGAAICGLAVYGAISLGYLL